MKSKICVARKGQIIRAPLLMIIALSTLLTACGGGSDSTSSSGGTTAVSFPELNPRPTQVIAGARTQHTAATTTPAAAAWRWSWGDGWTDDLTSSAIHTWYSRAVGSYQLQQTSTVDGKNVITPMAISVIGAPISTGRYNGDHVCAINADRTVSCWGGNAWGTLGDGTTTRSFSPVTVSGLTNARALSSGEHYNCALKTDGTIWCWGWGPLGDGTGVEESHVPVKVAGISTAVAIAAGQDHACAVLADQSVQCWGAAGYIGYALGDAALGVSGIKAIRPLPLLTKSGGPALGSVISISAGPFHTCALLTDHTVQCWGVDTVGEIGDGSTTPANSFRTVLYPRAVSGLGNVTNVYAGTNASCAVKYDGTAWCWGANGSGQLGDGTQINRTVPTQVQGLANVSSLALGGSPADATSCAVLTDGSVRCWGNFDYRIRGDGQGNANDLSLAPKTVSNIGGVTALAVNSHLPTMCATLANGEAWCWGTDAAWGNLGRGKDPSDGEGIPAPVVVGAAFWR